jgi:hypothetical protein
MNLLSQAKELIEVANRLNIEVELLNEEDSQQFIREILGVFKPFKITGHLAIGGDSISIPLDSNELLDSNEFLYSQNLEQENGYIFFDQYSTAGQKTVVKIADIRNVGKIIGESFGMEYFLSNHKRDFLIAVNWYVIEVSGNVKEKFITLEK